MLNEFEAEDVGAEALDLSGQTVGGYRLEEKIGVGGTANQAEKVGP